MTVRFWNSEPLVFVSIVVCVLSLSTLPIDAAIYLSPTGSDANLGGISSPVYTLNRAVSLAAAVDDIYAAAGTYVWNSQFLPVGAKTLSVYGAVANNPAATNFQADSALVVSTTNPLIYLGPNVNHNITFRDVTVNSNASAPLWIQSPSATVTFLGCSLRSKAEGLRSVRGTVRIISSTINSGTLILNNPEMTLFNNASWSGVSSIYSGTAIYAFSSGLVTMTNCRVSNAVAPSGSALLIQNTAIAISGSVFDSNTAFDTLAAVLWAQNATVTISNSRFEDNLAANGTVIYSVAGSSITISSSSFLRNSAFAGRAGAIYTSGGSLSITNSIFDSNTATSHGGSIFTLSTTVAMSSTSFKNCQSDGYGALCLVVSPSTLTNMTFDSNQAAIGGALYFESSTPSTITSSVFRANTAPTDFGGAIYLNNVGGITISNSLFQENSAVSAGAIVAVRSFATFNNCNFSSNVATGFGGAFLNIPPASGVISGTGCRFVGNVATRGGALAIQGATASFSNSVFSLNSAAFGAATYLVSSGGLDSTISISSSIIESSRAQISGGGFFLGSFSKLNILSSTVRNNTAAAEFGGAIFANESVITITSSLIDSNVGQEGGAIYAASGNLPTDITINGTSTFRANIAAYGGAIRFQGSNLRSTGTTWFQNGVTTYGGALFGVNPGRILIARDNFTQNFIQPQPFTTVFGGGLFAISFVAGSRVSINDTLFDTNFIAPTTANTTANGGGAILDSIEFVQLRNNTWRRNAGHDSGGGLMVRNFDAWPMSVSIVQNSFFENTANEAGGLVLGGPTSSVKMGSASLVDCLFQDNVALRADGAAVCSGGALSIRSYLDVSISRTNFISNGVACGLATDQGGAIYARSFTDPEQYGSLTIDSCTFDGNFLSTPDSIGGGLLAVTMEVAITNSVFTNHVNLLQGGGVFIQSTNEAPTRINNTRFSNNAVEVAGGAVALTGSETVLPSFICGNCTFVSNQATQPARFYSAAIGAAISLNSPWHVVVDKSSFVQNTAYSTAVGEFSAAGGAIAIGVWNSSSYGVYAELHITDSVFDSNSVGPYSASGGAISVREAGAVSIKRSTFLRSSSTFHAGAVSVAVTPLRIEDSQFSYSSATCSGGAIRVVGDNDLARDNLIIYRSTFEHNSMIYDADNTTGRALPCRYQQGGAITTLFLNTVEFRDSLFLNNSIEWNGSEREGAVDAGGGAIHTNSDGITPSNVTVTNCRFLQNRAVGPDSFGGGIFCATSNLTLTNTTFDANVGSVEGAGVFYHPSSEQARSLYMVGNRFTNNVGCNGGGAQILMRLQTRATISDNQFIGNIGFVSTDGFCTSSSGLGMQISGFSFYYPNITRCVFANNTLYDIGGSRAAGANVRASGIALRLVVEPGETRQILAPFGISDSVISDTLATTDDAAWGALAILASNQRAFVENTIFRRNRIMNYAGIDVGGTGAAFVASGVAGSSPGLSMLTVTNSRFESNSGDVGGSAMLRNSHSTLQNVTFIDNSGYSLAGALLIIGSEILNISAVTAPLPYMTNIQKSTRFISNRAGYSTDGCCYASLMVQGNHTLVVDTSTRFLLNEFDSQIGLATDLGCIVNATCRVVPVSSPGESIDLSGVLLAESSYLDLLQVTTSMRTLKVWDRAFKARRSYVDLGAYNLTSTNVTLFNFVTVSSPSLASGGQLNLYGQTEIIGAEPTKVFQSLRVNNFGVVKNYESTVVMRNCQIYNAPNASWDFENFSPQVNLTGSPSALAVSRARFINFGRLSVPSGSFQNISLDSSAPSSSVRFLVSNFWSPSHMAFDSLADVNFGGTFIMDGTPLRDYTEPAPFQTFLVASAAVASSMTIGFQSQESVGGYHYILNSVDVGSSRNLTLQVRGFYPTDVRISDEATFIRVTFPRPTNVPGGILGTDCNLFIESQFLTSMTAPECVWKSPTELNIRASKFGPTLRTTALIFKNAVITDVIDPAFYVWGNKSHLVTLPTRPPSPKIVLVAPPLAVMCSSLTFDASATYGTGAFPTTFSWTLEFINNVSPASLGSSTATNLASFIASQTASIFTIPAASLEVSWTSLNISLTVSASGLGTTATQRVQVLRDASSSSLVQVRIEGSLNRVIPTAVDSQIQATFSAPSCQPLAPTNVVRSSWTVISTSQSPSPLNSLRGVNTTTIYIPARSLAPDSVHKFRYTATVYSDSAPSSSILGTTTAIVSVTAVGSPMSLISTGRSGLVSTTQPIQINVKLIDPDEQSYVARPDAPQFAWVILACPDRGQRNTKTSSDAEIAFAIQQSSAGTFEENNTTRTLDSVKGRQSGAVCSFPNGTRYTLPFPTIATGDAASSFVIQPNYLAPGEYSILAISARGSRSTTALISLSVEADATSYNSVRIEAELRGADKHLAQNKLVLRGFVDGSNTVPAQRSVRWSLVGQTLNASAVSTSIDNINLVLSPAALLSGRGYTFQLDVLQNGVTVTGSSTLTIVVNSSPRGGNFSVSPSTGGLVGGLFNVAVPGWIDDDPPLRYIIYVIDPLSNKAVVLSDLVELPNLQVSIPIVGSVPDGYLLEIRARIADTFESITEISNFIQVLPNPAYQEGSQTAQSRDSLIAANRFALIAGDFRTSMSSILQLLPLIQSDSTAKCEAATAVDTFAHSIQLTAATLQTILQPLDSLTRSDSGLSPCVLEIVLSTLERAVDGSEAASRLSASQNSAARSAALEVLRTISNLVKSISGRPNIDESTRLRLLQILLRLAKTQNAFSVLDEVPTLLSANDLLVLTANLSGNALSRINITLGDVSVILGLVDPNDRIDLNLVRWINSTFPLVSVTGQVIGSTVITTTTSGGQVGTITVLFGPGDSGPAGNSSSGVVTPVACGVYDETLKRFDTTGCTLSSRPGGSYACTCTRTGSLALLFDLGTSGSTTPPGIIDISGGNVGAIAAGVTVALLVVFAAVGSAYFIKRHLRKKEHKANMRQRAAEMQQQQNEAEMQPKQQPELVGRPSTSWAVARPSISAADIDSTHQ